VCLSGCLFHKRYWAFGLPDTTSMISRVIGRLPHLVHRQRQRVDHIPGVLRRVVIATILRGVLAAAYASSAANTWNSTKLGSNSSKILCADGLVEIVDRRCRVGPVELPLWDRQQRR